MLVTALPVAVDAADPPPPGLPVVADALLPQNVVAGDDGGCVWPGSVTVAACVWVGKIESADPPIAFTA